MFRCYEVAAVQACLRFRPCLHNFFLENFRQPGTWYEKRLAYTRATAVNSMAGYLIGLGDRHSQNILIDKKSAEVGSRHAIGKGMHAVMRGWRVHGDWEAALRRPGCAPRGEQPRFCMHR